MPMPILMSKFPNDTLKGLLIPHLYGTSHLKALSNENVLGIWKNNSKLLKMEPKSWKNTCEGTPSTPSKVFFKDFTQILGTSFLLNRSL